MNKIVITAVTALVLQACTTGAGKKEPGIPSGAIPVKLIAIRQDTSEAAIQASGSFYTEEEARLSFKTSGVISQVLVREGDRVRKGQLLATLKPTEIAAQVQQVQLSIEKAERDYQRAQNLYADSVATLEQVQNARTALDIARQGMQQVRFNEQYSRIYAPANGIITRRSGNEGEIAAPGQPVLLMGSSGGSAEWVLRIGLPDHEWSQLETGDRATIETDAYPGKQLQGRISKKALAADPASGTFPIEIAVSTGQLQPAAGMFGRARIYPKKPVTGTSIPYEALLEADGRKGYVFVSDDRKTVKKVPVTIHSISDQVAYISQGLEGHSYIVSSGSPYLNDQSTITVTE